VLILQELAEDPTTASKCRHRGQNAPEGWRLAQIRRKMGGLNASTGVILYRGRREILEGRRNRVKERR